MAKLSPMMQQYFQIKQQHEDHIVMFRLGDFYEMFFDDAKIASKELELTLTGRDCGQEERAPMCGVPYHSCDAYIARLVQKGYKVAICEQMEDPALAKGIVQREVTRVITPGTVIENSMLDEGSNNYICSVYLDGCCGICFADVSTGDVFLAEMTKGPDSILDELAGYEPKEAILSPALCEREDVTRFIEKKLGASYEKARDGVYSEQNLQRYVYQRFAEDAARLQKMPGAAFALLALMEYNDRMQTAGLDKMGRLHFYNESQYMMLGVAAKANLEIVQTIRSKEKKGTLLWVLDKTKTAMGKRLLRREIERPLLQCDRIRARSEAVGELVANSILRAEVGQALSGVYDIERLLSRVVFGTVNARELKSLQWTLRKLPATKELLLNVSSASLRQCCDDLDLLEDLEQLLNRALVDEPPFSVKEGGLIKKGFDPQIDELADLLANGKSYLAALEARERENTGIKNLKVSYNKVFGYYIEVTRSYLNMVPDTFIRKQTLANCERFITQELKELEVKILSASDRVQKLEYEMFCTLRDTVAQNLHRVEQSAKALARLDFLYSLAKVAGDNNYVRPEVDESDVIEVRDGRHPVVEKMHTDELFVANDAHIDQGENQLLLITGPNMAGKSTYMRQTALIVIMAQIGSFVPCSYAHIGICDQIFTRIGASDDLSAGQSTFMVEMSELAQILHGATRRSLLILDEIGRGTSTFDGMSIARSVIEFLVEDEKHPKTLFATHYHELTELEGLFSEVKNYHIAVKKRGDDITFLRRIVRGETDDSYGIEVAKLAGIPEEIVQRAKQVLRQIEAQQPVRAAGAGLAQQPTAAEPVDVSSQAILQKIKDLDLSTITPIEALNVLYKLNQELAARDEQVLRP